MGPTGTSSAIAFRCSSAPAAVAAAGELRQRYGDVPLDRAGVVVVVGGDGAMIDALHAVLGLGPQVTAPPVFGMHCGTAGFLMNDYRLDALPARLAAAEPSTIRPLRMCGDAEDGTPLAESLACNEVALRRLAEQSARIRVTVDGTVRLDELRGDGILVATAVGSTAYNLSAHGPIVPLGAGLLALTPICAMTPRRWTGALLGRDSVVRLEVLEAAKRPVAASADQRDLVRVRSVEVSEAAGRSLQLLFDPGRALAERVVREQFSW